MTRRGFEPEDVYRLKTAADPNVSPDGRRVAWVQIEADKDEDRLASSIWVASLDGSPPRAFTEGPSDSAPRWSPDGRWLAYVSAPKGEPRKAHLRLASLEGGAPRRLAELDGPVSQPQWSPDSSRIVAVVLVGARDLSQATPSGRNAPRRVRGLADRLDGAGVHDGRRHLVVVDVASGTATQITQGEYDHSEPSWSPDGSQVACASDRDRRRDDRQFQADVWVVPAAAGRARRVTAGGPRAGFPQFSPDGSKIGFTGIVTPGSWDDDTRLFVVPADGSAEPAMVAPDTDRGMVVMPGGPVPWRWLTDSSLAVLLADRGSIGLHLASLARRTSRPVVAGDRQIDGFSLAGPSGRTVAYTAMWPDRPSEVWVSPTTGGQARQVSHMNDAFVEEVALSPVMRAAITRPDGTEIEYFTILPPEAAGKGRSAGRRLPVHLDIHGGPHGLWPVGRFLAMHQSFAAAGYAVVLPNPRGSTSYGQEFTRACTDDWGGADCEDILACCDDVVARGIGDEDRMFVGGGSYGGFMTSWIVGHSSRFKAAAAMAAVIDQTSMALTTEIPYFSTFNFGGTPWDNPDEYRKRSPLTYLPDVKTPVLVVHWEGDLRVPIGQGEELYAGLRLLGKEAEFVRYPGGFHIYRSPSQTVDWARQILAWNARFDAKASRRATTAAPKKPPAKKT